MAPSRLSAQAVAYREATHRGSAIAEAKLGEQLLPSVSQNDVPDRAVRKRAVVQRFFWRYWLRRLLTGCRTPGLCVLMPGLSSLLEGVPNAKFAERSVAPAGVAPATSLRSDSTTVDTSLATKPAQLSHTVCKQHLTSVLLLHLLQRRQLGHTTRRGGTPCAFVSVWAVFWHSSLLAAAGLAGSPRYAGS